MDMASCDIAGASSLVIGILLARALGSSVPADGFSAPYRIAMGFATGLYGKTECNPHLNRFRCGD